MKFLLLFSIISSAYAANYEAIFPHYYEYCAGTMLRYQKEYFEGAKGGAGGHAIVYLHGICKDYTKDYPQVKICDKTDNHAGVGISLDSDFKNVAWVAVPGRDLLLFGDNHNIKDLIQKSFELEIFKNVKLKSIQESSTSKETENNIALFSIGTNIALNWARELRCVKVPVLENNLNKAVTFLNTLNDSYYVSKKEFKWSMLYNNCTHLSINIGNTLGLNKAIKTQKNFFGQLGNLGIPANHYLSLMDKIVLNTNVKESSKFSPNQVGALATHYPAYPSNEVFITDNLQAFTLQPRKKLNKIFSSSKSYGKYVELSKYNDLKENALYWKDIYLRMNKQDVLPSEYITNQLSLIDNILNL